MTDLRSLTITHAPFGLEHPYEQLPQERFPREPLACQPFSIGVLTHPPQQVTRLVIRPTIDGQQQPVIEAVKAGVWQPQPEHGTGMEFLEHFESIAEDIWRASLTAPQVGQTLSYQIEAHTSDGEVIPGDTYSLRGADWTGGGGFLFDGARTIVTRDGTRGASPAGLPHVTRIDWLEDGEHARRVRLTFACAPDERFFGLGERFNALDQRGQVLDVRVYEQYRQQGKRTYIPIPFMLSSAGYGVWVENSRWMQFDLAATLPDSWVLEADVGADETLTLRWFTGGDPLDIIRQFTTTTGPAALPPEWAFGLWMSGNEWNSQARVIEEVEASLANDIQPSVLVIEAWSDETTFYIWNDAEYTPKAGGESFRYDDFTFPPDGKWHDPKGMVDWLHKLGIRLVLWQNPVLKHTLGTHPQHDADRADFEARGFGVRNPDGSLYRVRPPWFRDGYLWDPTRAEERDWWLNKRAYLLDDMGIDGFKTDGGEHLWSTSAVFSDGRTGEEVWNEYPRHYAEAYYRFANARREAITFSRAGFVGSQRAPLHWAGDEASTWDAYRASILAGLSAGISGIPFWGWDIGGFSGDLPSGELYLRATAMATFCPVMQYHSEYNAHREPRRDRTPWNIQKITDDDRVIPTFRGFVELRQKLMPYIWSEAQHSAQSGEPMMRALKLWHPEASDYQYYFGRDLLICPVVEPDVREWTVYLPPGEWRDVWTQAVYQGGQSHTVPAPIERIPVFARAGADLPI